jgi:GTPase SAR1 family protein
MFAGREKELSRIARLCRGEVESYVILLGARQSGKTSLLYRLGGHLGNRAQVVPVNLQGLPNGGPAEVFHHIAQELVAELGNRDRPTDRFTDNIHSAPALKQLLCDLAPKRTTVVTIDEIGTIQPQAASDLANALRSFHQDRLRSRYGALRHYIFVLAGGIELYELAASNVSTLYNISDKLYLGDLSRAESDALLRRGFDELSIEQPVARSLCDRIFHYTRGHPYFTQRLGSFIEEMLGEYGRVPTPAELDEMALDVSRDDTNIVSLVNGLRKEGLWVEARRLARGEIIPFSRIASVPCRLELLGLIRDEDGRSVMRNPIYKETIRLGEAEISKEERGELQLADIHPGTEDAKAYEQCVFETLYRFFDGQLSFPERESRTVGGTQRRDIMFFNASLHAFWQLVGRQHDAIHIVFECKNTESLKLGYVDQLVGYLGQPLGNFGVIVSRVPPGENLKLRAITAFNRNEKVVLFLSDEDLNEMAQLHAQGRDPTTVIERKYVELTRAVQ